MKKYELILDDSIEILNHKLFRIRALTDFGSVKAGDLGGYIQKEENLSQDGEAWVSGKAKVFGNSRVFGNARVSGKAKVFGKSRVSGKAKVYDGAKVYGDAEVYGKAKVYGDAEVYDRAWVSGDAEVYDNAKVHGDAEVYGDARIKSKKDYIVFKNNWSSGRYFTYTKSNKMWKVGCFYGTSQELIKKAYGDSEDSGNHYKACVDFVETLE